MTEVDQLHRYLKGHRGKLHIQGHVFKKWKPRYFVLEKKKVKYYADENMGLVNGEYALERDTQIYDVPGESEGRKFLFYLTGKNPTTENDILFVSANSEKDKREWIEALSDAIHDGFKQINQPELWKTSFYPSIDISLTYTGAAVSVENGNILKPSFVAVPPAVAFKLSSNCTPHDKFSLVMMDFDPVGTADNPVEQSLHRAYLHWGVVNFQGSDVTSGDELAHYVPPAPAYNSGLHRYFFLLFKHTSLFSAVQRNETTELFLKRESFDYHRWTKMLGFGDPVAINGFYSGWEDYCDQLHTLLNYFPPEAYRSPRQDIAFLAQAEEAKVEKARLDLYRDLGLSDIFPASVDFSVKSPHKTIAMNITYGDVVARDGSILTPKEVYRQPRVAYEVPAPLPGEEATTYFTLILCDPDAPSRVNHSMREFIHWVVVNIPGSDISAGVELLPYLGSAPPYSSGLHRYVFSLYKQTSLLTAKVADTGKKFFADRKGILSHDWISHNRNSFVATPVGVEAYLAEWDDSCDAIHAQLNFVPPPQFRSPSQVLIAHNESEKLDAAAKVAAEKEKQKARQAAEESDRIQRLLAAEAAFKEQMAAQAVPASERGQEGSSGSSATSASSSVNASPVRKQSHSMSVEEDEVRPARVSATASVAERYVAAANANQDSPKVSAAAAQSHTFTTTSFSSGAVLPPAAAAPSQSAPPASATSGTASAAVTVEAITVKDLVKKYSLANMNLASAEETAPVAVSAAASAPASAAVQQQAPSAPASSESTPVLVSSTTTSHATTKVVHKEAAYTATTASVTGASIAPSAPAALAPAPAPVAAAPVVVTPPPPPSVVVVESAPNAIQQQILLDQQQILKNQQEQIALQQEQQRILIDQQRQILEAQQAAAHQAKVDAQQAKLREQEERLLAPRPEPGPLQRKYSAKGFASSSEDSLNLAGLNVSSPSPVTTLPPKQQASPSNLRTRSASPAQEEGGRPKSPQSILKETENPLPRGAGGLQKKISFRADVDSFVATNDVKPEVKRRSGNLLPPSSNPPAPPAASPTSGGAGGSGFGGGGGLTVQTNMPPPQPKFLQRNASVQNMGSNSGAKKGIQRSPSVANMNNSPPGQGLPAFSPGRPPARSTSPGRNKVVSSGMDALDDLISYTPPGASGGAAGGGGYNSIAMNNASFDFDDNASVGSSKQRNANQPLMRTQSMYSTNSQGEKKASLFGVQGLTAESPRSNRKTMNEYGASAGRQSRDQVANEFRARIAAASNVNELCEIFGISSTTVFEGEIMKKKFSKDFMFKDSYLWIDPLTKSIHWGKSAADKQVPKNQKHLLLDRVNSSSGDVKPSGEMKGILKSVEFSGSNILITIESGELLEMKLSPDGYPPSAKRATDWVKVIRSFTDIPY